MGRYIRPVDFAGGNALFKSLTGKNAKQYLLDFQRDVVAYEIKSTELDPSEPELPTPMDAYIGGRQWKDYEGDKAQLVQARMPFASTIRFVDPSVRGEDIDFVKEIQLIMAELRGRYAIPVVKGFFGRNFYYVVGNQFSKIVPPADSFTIIGVTNLAQYSSTMENPTWHRPFNKCWTGYVRRRAAKMGYEARFRYLGGASWGYYHRGIRPDPNRKQSYPRWINYAVPLIEIGPIGSMRGKVGKLRARHGRNRRRMV
jgi:hypothetical protein